MKVFSFLIFFIFISLYMCEEQEKVQVQENICDEQCQKMIDLRNENNLKFNNTIKECLKEMNLENVKNITIEQFKVIFMKLFTLGKSHTNYKEEDDEEYRNHLFNNLVPEGAEGIPIDNIFDLFKPTRIVMALKKIEISLGKYNKIEQLSENLRKSLEEIEEQKRISNKKNETNEQNSDL